MSLVLGKDTILYVKENNVFKPIACARNCVFTTTTETAGKSTIGSGLYREFKPIVNSGSLSIDGLVSADTNVSIATMRTFQINFDEIFFQFHVVDINGDGYLYSGKCILTSVAETGNYNDVTNYSIQAVVTGDVTITSLIGNPGIIYFGTQDNFDDPIDFTHFITQDPNQDITIAYDHPASSLYYWMAHSISAAQKTNWEDENEAGNAGTIGGETDLFQVRYITINGSPFVCYMTAYATFFNGYDPTVKFYRIPTGCDAPTNFQITNIVNSGDDTGAITDVTSENILNATFNGNATILTAAGVTTANFTFDTIVSSDFTASLGNTRFTYTGVAAKNVSIQWIIQGLRHSASSPFVLQPYINGSPVVGYSTTLNSNHGTFDVPYYWFNTLNVVLNPGDYIEFNANATSSGTDTAYLLTETLATLNVTSSSTSQQFQITGAPQIGGVFSLSIYGNLLTYLVTALTTNALLAQALTDLINNAAIAVPSGNQPPAIVAATHTTGSDTFTIVSGTPPVATASYAPVSMATVTFNWTEPSPPANTYTIQITNTGTAETTYNIGDAPQRNITLARGYTYKFAIRSNCDSGSSDFTTQITQNIP